MIEGGKFKTNTKKMLSLESFVDYEILNQKHLTGGESYAWRDGSSAHYSDTTSTSDEELVTSYADSSEASNDGCGGSSCIDSAYDCGDGKVLF